jgi:hypothetical protein
MGVHVANLVSWGTSSADLRRLVNRMFAFAANAADRTDRHRSIA